MGETKALEDPQPEALANDPDANPGANVPAAEPGAETEPKSASAQKAPRKRTKTGCLSTFKTRWWWRGLQQSLTD